MTTVEPSTNLQPDGIAVHSYPNLLQGVAQATNQLLTTSDFATAIDSALATLGQVTGVDRVYIFEIHPHPETGEPAMSQRFEWAGEAITAEIDNPGLQNLTFAACGMSRWYDTLLAGNSCSGLVRELSTLARQLLESQKILSVLVVPIPVNGKLWGFIGFDDCHSERQWSNDESAVLMTMAATIGSCIAQQQIKDALRQSQLRLEKIAANVPGMIFQFLQRKDSSRSVLYASSACRELYELEPEDIEGNFQILANLTHPDDRASWEQSVRASAATGATWKWEGRIITPSGKLKWVQGASRLERQLTGDLLWDGLVIDITERKQAEEALRQSEVKNRALLHAIPDLIFRVTGDGVFLDCHAENTSDLVAPVSELIGKKLYDVLPAPVAQLCTQHIRQALSTGVIQTLEYELPLDGIPRYWEARHVVCGDDEVLVIVREITDRKRAEEERQLTAERDRLLGKIALRIRTSLDLEQILQTTVAEVRQFLGCDRVFFTHIADRLNGEVAAESIDPKWGSVLGMLRNNPKFIKEIKAVFESGNVQAINDITQAEVSPLRAKYFAQYQVKACLAVPIMVNNKLFGNLVAHQCDRPRQWQPFEVDLLRALATQVAIAVQQAQLYQQVQALNANLERQVEERTQQLAQKYTELQELAKLKDVLLHAVSHDLRTAVLGWLMVLKNLLASQHSRVGSQEQRTTDDGQRTIPVCRSVLERMIQSSDRQLYLINSLLEVHAGEVVGVAIERESLQLADLVRSLVEDLQPLVAKSQVKLLNRIPANLPAISADPAQLRRVFEHLLTNALKHNPPGIAITLEARVKKGTIYCTVADNGVGMNQQKCDRLFQLYFRSQDAQQPTQGHRPYTGLGLGLYLCRQIITAHGGEIGVKSRQGAGTTFWFTLPALLSPDQSYERSVTN